MRQRTEATEHVEHLRCLLNRLADVVEGIGEVLEAASVGGDVHIALHQIAELRLQIDSTMQLVVLKLIMDRVPDRVRRGSGNTLAMEL